MGGQRRGDLRLNSHTNLIIWGKWCDSYSIYSNKLHYQITSDGSDRAGGVRHMQEAWTTRKDQTHWTFSVEWEEEERRGECRILVWRMHMQQGQTEPRTSPGWGFFLSRRTACWARPKTWHLGNNHLSLVARTTKKNKRFVFYDAIKDFLLAALL